MTVPTSDFRALLASADSPSAPAPASPSLEVPEAEVEEVFPPVGMGVDRESDRKYSVRETTPECCLRSMNSGNVCGKPAQPGGNSCGVIHSPGLRTHIEEKMYCLAVNNSSKALKPHYWIKVSDVDSLDNEDRETITMNGKTEWEFEEMMNAVDATVLSGDNSTFKSNLKLIQGSKIELETPKKKGRVSLTAEFWDTEEERKESYRDAVVKNTKELKSLTTSTGKDLETVVTSIEGVKAKVGPVTKGNLSSKVEEIGNHVDAGASVVSALKSDVEELGARTDTLQVKAELGPDNQENNETLFKLVSMLMVDKNNRDEKEAVSGNAGEGSDTLNAEALNRIVSLEEKLEVLRRKVESRDDWESRMEVRMDDVEIKANKHLADNKVAFRDDITCMDDCTAVVRTFMLMETELSGGTFVDSMDFFHGVSQGSQTKREVVGYKATIKKANIKNDAEATKVTSLNSDIPPIFRKEDTAGGGLSNVPSFSAWQNSANKSGVKDRLTSKISGFKTMVTARIGRCTDPEVKLLATRCLSGTVSFVEGFLVFSTNMYQKILSREGQTKEVAWEITAMACGEVLDYIKETQSESADIGGEADRGLMLGSMLWSTLRCHAAMAEFTDQGFENHSCVSSCLIRFLTFDQPQSGDANVMSEINTLKAKVAKVEVNIKKAQGKGHGGGD